MKILLLAPYPPFPPHGGGSMRIYQIARGLAAHHDLSCLTFAVDPAAEAAMAPLHDICRVFAVRGPASRSMVRRAATTFSSSLPDMALRNASPAYAAALDHLLAAESFEVVVAESIEMAGYLLQIAQGPRRGPRLVLDQFNAEYQLQQRAAFTSLRNALRGGGHRLRELAGGLYSLVQWQKLAAYERYVMRCCDAIAVVSDDDRRMLARLAGHDRFAVVPNGVDTAAFAPAAVSGALAFAAPTLVFSGTLDFRANVDALTWFAGRPLDLLRAVRPDLQLVAVGRRPTAALQALAAAGRLVLTGEVADARPYIAGADVYIVPMRIGGGMRLKLLEALALEAPVVSTTMGAEGVNGLAHETHCLLADGPAAFADAVLRLLADPALGRRLAGNGRRLVVEQYDWGAIIPRMAALLEA
ncbi:MAG TPA: glycosyltransferase family 4 protein [Roseiflexaceae bacterium]|nr:glycosyltransferase family 4 protein [Roseiflexaceae bacterium]